ncbi:MAG: ABC transporter permease [Bacteroides sp.]|nr:ABC transporter permease [Bacteroides sp.]
MRQLYYTIQTLIRGKGSNILKILSLTLGLFISILLFARVAFELSYNRNYQDAENLYAIYASYTIENKTNVGEIIVGPIPSKLAELFPEEIESATVVRDHHRVVFYNSDHRIGNIRTIFADSDYFRTMGIEVISGDTEELNETFHVFISQTLSRQIFEDKNPIGEILMYDKNLPVTVRGVYKDLPQNCSMPHDVVISLPTVISHFRFGYGWNGGDSYKGFVRFKNKAAVGRIEARLPDFVKTYMVRF